MEDPEDGLLEEGQGHPQGEVEEQAVLPRHLQPGQLGDRSHLEVGQTLTVQRMTGTFGGDSSLLDRTEGAGLSVLALTGVPGTMSSCYGGRTTRSAGPMSSYATGPADGT